MSYEVTVGGASVRAEVTQLGDGRYEVTLDGHKSIVDARFPEPGVMHLIRNGEAFEFDHIATADGYEVTLYGTRYLVEVLDERRKVLRALGRGAGDSGGQVLSTSMPGKVVALLVELGDVVEEDQGIVVVEAMKMENELKASGPGVVKEIAVATGDTVEGGATLVVLGPVEET
jgi:biotin carboxyl carrier protein